jgi:co-chaperonin GroES (HSP10)
MAISEAVLNAAAQQLASKAVFPRRPLLDRVIVREIPIEEFYEQGDVNVPLNDKRITLRTDRGVVVAAGDCVMMGGMIIEMPVKVGDVVFFDEFAMCDPIYLNPADRNRTDLPKYWHMRVGDLKGVQV